MDFSNKNSTQTTLDESLLGNKGVKEDDWTFRKADTQYMTHGIHVYPARMIPQIAAKLIKRYSKEGDTIYDPFCGSGTTLAEARRLNRNALGNDLNPLAVLISNVKSTLIEPKKLRETWYNIAPIIIEQIEKYRNNEISVDTSIYAEDVNIDYWFKPNVLDILTVIRSILFQEITEKKILDFFKVCFSSSTRKVSNVRNGEYKLYRISEEKLEEFKPDVFKIFESNVVMNIKRMDDYYISCKGNDVFTHAFLYDSLRITDSIILGDEEHFKNDSIDLIVTSPPYGDSQTTVGYGQFSRYPLIILGFEKEETYSIDKRALGGQISPVDIPKSPLAQKTLNEISTNSEKRAKVMEAFYADLNQCLINMHRILKNKSHACIVIANRSVARVRVPTDEIIVEFSKELGFKHVITHNRYIPSKSMPQKSKFIVDGEEKWIETMTKEKILILQKK